MPDYYTFKLEMTASLPSDVRPLVAEEKTICNHGCGHFEQQGRPLWVEDDLTTVPPAGRSMAK